MKFTLTIVVTMMAVAVTVPPVAAAEDAEHLSVVKVSSRGVTVELQSPHAASILSLAVYDTGGQLRARKTFSVPPLEPFEPPEHMVLGIEPIFGGDDVGVFQEEISWNSARPGNGVYIVVATFKDAPPLTTTTKFSLLF